MKCKMGAQLFLKGVACVLKKPKTIAQQIEILKAKNISIQDEDRTKDFLNRVNYYRFSGYFLPFQTNGHGTLSPDITFEKLLAIYEFDEHMRTLVMGIIDEIEIFLRMQLSHYHAMKYGEEGYMDVKYYNGRHNHKRFINHINSCIRENAGTKVVQHHMEKYGGHFPIWVIVEFFSMGMLSFFYSDMLNSDKSNISKALYGVNYQTMESWMKCLTILRNKCAHHARLYYQNFALMPRIPKAIKHKPTRKIFTQLYMLKLMYPRDNWDSAFVKPFAKLVKVYSPYISKEHLGLPRTWKAQMKK